MEDKQKCTAPEQGACHPCASRLCGFAPLILGFVVALVFGWWIFPELMYASREQPVAFSHETHVTEAGMDCVDCHSLRDDGTFAAFPTTQDCAECHIVALGDSEAERFFIENYVETGREVDWLVYQKQPDNVYFSHATHSMESCNMCHTFSQQELCQFCHIALDKGYSPAMEENRISGYSKNTMKMWQCEACHADPNHLAGTNANNACFVCHK